MKKISILAAILIALAPALASAHSYSYSTYTYTGTATSGNALASDVVDARELESLDIVGSVATADRAITVTCLAVDKTTVLFTLPTVTAVAAGQAKQRILINPDATVPGTAPTGTTIWNIPLCPWMQVNMASAAGTAQLDIMGRRQQVAAQTSRCARYAIDRSQPDCYESGSVTAGAALTAGVMDTRRAEALTVIVEATTTNRTLVVSCTDSTGTSLFDFASLTVTAGSKFMQVFRPDSPTPGSEPTGVTHFPLNLCRYMTATIAAAGAASAKLATYLR
jgi:hypothetical protein